LVEGLAVAVVMEAERLAVVVAGDRKVTIKVSNEEGAWSRNVVVVDRPKGVTEVEADPQTEAADVEAGVCQIVVEVGVLRMAEEAGAHDMNGKMRQT
jgi:hypothetical protein